jgi:rubrerythrin
MNLLDFAMEIESEGIEFYTDLMKNTPARDIAGLFGFFAKEEKRHYEIFEAWKKNVRAPTIEKTGMAEKSQEVFTRLSANFMTAGTPAIDHEDAYRKAMSLEEKSILFYNDLQAAMRDEEQKLLIALIIQQEHTHARVIRQLMEFQRHPNEWLENAEWNHYENY